MEAVFFVLDSKAMLTDETAESVGRPVGSKAWIADMEARTGIALDMTP